MSTPEQNDRRKGKMKASLAESLHNPTQLRICVMGIVLLIGYYAVFVPLDGRIAKTAKKLARQTKNIELGANLERLQNQYAVLAPRVPRQASSEEWVQYLLNGLRGMSVKMNNLDCREPKQFGPLQVFIFSMELEGNFFDLDKFLRWVETDRRLFRVDEVSMRPRADSAGGAAMRITLLGLSG